MRNLQVFRRNFAEDPTVRFPKPYPELTTGRVLTMERLRGHKVTDGAFLDRLDVDRQELARRGANVFVEMIFRDGFYHADPHPGNFMVLPDGTIGLLDAGMVGRMDEPMRMNIAEVLLAAGDRDAQRLTDAVLRMCGTPETLDRSVLSNDLTDFFEEYGTQAVGQFNVSGALNAVTVILHEHKLMLPGNISMLFKCLILLEGTGCLLSPTFNLAELLEPWRKRFLKQRFSKQAQLRQFRRLFVDWERAAEAIPKVTSRLLDRLEQGHFAIHLEHQHLKSAVNRLVVGLFVSALLLGSSILIASDVPPMIRGVSIPGALGYLAAIAFGLRTLWINRDKLVQRRRGDWE
jgi:ubiquinone biosynthesis protein